jgi:hypothetical protein
MMAVIISLVTIALIGLSVMCLVALIFWFPP